MDWFRQYYDAFGKIPFYAEPSNDIVVEDESGALFVVNEPQSVTLERIKRSEVVGRNLFFEELPQFNPYPDKEAQY